MDTRDEKSLKLNSRLKKILFSYVSLDLKGYRTGSLNPEKRAI
jgi:PP-loop superfamily ATP-utilizing enzyme